MHWPFHRLMDGQQLIVILIVFFILFICRQKKKRKREREMVKICFLFTPINEGALKGVYIESGERKSKNAYLYCPLHHWVMGWWIWALLQQSFVWYTSLSWEPYECSVDHCPLKSRWLHLRRRRLHHHLAWCANCGCLFFGDGLHRRERDREREIWTTEDGLLRSTHLPLSHAWWGDVSKFMRSKLSVRFSKVDIFKQERKM